MTTETNAKETNTQHIQRRRWTPGEEAILKAALESGSYRNTDELLRDMSIKLNRTMAAIYSRINKEYRNSLENAFLPQNASQVTFTDIPSFSEENPSSELDSALIFSLYEQLTSFHKVVNDLREENETLQKYYSYSEKEIKKLTEALQVTKQERDRAIDHIKNIEQMITVLNDNGIAKKQEQGVAV